MDPNQMPVSAEPKKGVGALIGSIVVILILVLGALYFWGGKIEKANNNENTATAGSEASDIDADFNSLEKINLDEDLNAINQ